MKVLKFGGSSVANAKNIGKVIDIVLREQKKHKEIIVVVSALGGVTDGLIRMASEAVGNQVACRSFFKEFCEKHNQAVYELIPDTQQSKVLSMLQEKYAELENLLHGISLLKELSLRSLDAVMSYGEQFSACIVSKAIEHRGVACVFVDSRQLITTDDHFGAAHVDVQKSYAHLAHSFKKIKTLAVMGGFIGSTRDGVTTTLGRGGSDYTAALVGAALNAEAIEIWTDVDGVLTADPRKVPYAFPLPVISYDEAGELAHFGAKVIHPKTMRPAQVKGIPLYIKNTFNPDHAGTRISNDKTSSGPPVKGITSLGKVSLLRCQSNNGKSIGDTSAEVFDVLCRAGIEVLLTTQASYEQAISIAVRSADAERARQTIEQKFALEIKMGHIAPLSLEKDLSIIAIVGKEMKGVPGISGQFFYALGSSCVNIVAIAQGSSELNISAVIRANDEERALRAVHETFFAPAESALHMFMIGVGLIGSEVLRQIEKKGLPIRVCGLADSKTMVVDRAGVDRARLVGGEKKDIRAFVERMIALQTPNTVFVDCTASDEPVQWYAPILRAGITVVTPNKKANSGRMAQYNELRLTSAQKNGSFRYTTNVGAGLPIVDTLQKMRASGDPVQKIEAVLSGSLSYIFSRFSSSDKKFSDVVREAQQKGYTEPDPRDDLSGMDFARKMLILGRESGATMEMRDVRVVPMLPRRCFEAKSVEHFFVALQQCDALFEKKKQHALKNNRVLRCVGMLESGKVTIGLREIEKKDSCANLVGSENIAVIFSERYRECPLVIKGPGAGAEVTAGGVLADVMSVVRDQESARGYAPMVEHAVSLSPTIKAIVKRDKKELAYAK